MFFPEDQGNQEQHKRTITIMENGVFEQKPIQITLTKKKMGFKQLGKILGINNLRLFSSEGAQYFEQDIEYIKNKTVLYASKGQDFDPACCFGQYEMLRKLGEGGFGKVFLAEKRQTKQLFAIKIVKTENIGSAAEIDSIFGQMEILKSLKHENIVRVHNCLTLKNMEVVIIMEYLGGGELLKLVQDHRLNEETAKVYIKQIVKGMVYCHQNNLIHRDLKLENILLLNQHQDKVKIIDFGIAGVVNSLTWEDMDTGSLSYMAPQCFINQKNYKVDGRIDVWAVGVILYCMLTGQLPFTGNSTAQVIQAIKSAIYKIPSEVQKTLTWQCKQIISLCLNPNCKTRPTMEELLEHPWIDGGLFKAQDTKISAPVQAKLQQKQAEAKKSVKIKVTPKKK